mmetsp:Transcript_17595/g.28118  ORF Transcript_17595/g.28118 Transcript_17595/m.28118 type:complete len:117 (+) Transcript_17595:991-1341(+)
MSFRNVKCARRRNAGIPAGHLSRGFSKKGAQKLGMTKSLVLFFPKLYYGAAQASVLDRTVPFEKSQECLKKFERSLIVRRRKKTSEENGRAEARRKEMSELKERTMKLMIDKQAWR